MYILGIPSTLNTISSLFLLFREILKIKTLCISKMESGRLVSDNLFNSSSLMDDE